MRIKHWAGYGCVNAKKISDGTNAVVVEVCGNHEWGLLRPFYDESCIKGWLGRFLKGRTLDHYIVTDWGCKDVNGERTDYAIYCLFVKED